MKDHDNLPGWALSKQFRFDAAHTLPLSVESQTNRRIHGHSYRAEITLRGVPEPTTGMLMDLATFERALDQTRVALDHQFLDEVPGLGPATLENLCAWIWNRLAPALPLLARVAIYRDGSGDGCTYTGPQDKNAPTSPRLSSPFREEREGTAKREGEVGLERDR